MAAQARESQARQDGIDFGPIQKGATTMWARNYPARRGDASRVDGVWMEDPVIQAWTDTPNIPHEDENILFPPDPPATPEKGDPDS